MPGRRIEVGKHDTVIYRGLELDATVLQAIVSTNKRVLWAFIKKSGNIMAVPYSEEQCIWMTEADVMQPEEVEL